MQDLAPCGLAPVAGSIAVNPQFPGSGFQVITGVNADTLGQDGAFFPVPITRHAEQAGDIHRFAGFAPDIDPAAGLQGLIEQLPSRKDKLFRVVDLGLRIVRGQVALGDPGGFQRIREPLQGFGE